VGTAGSIGGIFSDVELAVGLIGGFDAEACDLYPRGLRRGDASEAPSAALLRTIRACMRPTTFVEFSGGVDSSLVLCAAARVARETGSELPVPVTLRFPGYDETDERWYQAAVIEALGLRDWIVLEDVAHVDYLSAESQRELRAGGLAVSPRLHGRVWWLERLTAGDGALLSGEGGDEVLGPAPLAPLYRAGRSLVTRTNVGPNLRVAGRWARAQTGPWDRRIGFEFPEYLTPMGLERAVALLGEVRGQRSFRVASALERHRTSRSMSLMLSQLEEQSARFGLSYSAPLLDHGFMHRLSAIPDRHFLGRSYLLEKYFADLVPEVVLRRRTKAYFRGVCFGEQSLAFAARWNGEGVPTDLVDSTRLRACWQGAHDARSSLLLQAAWLATEGRP
jgi:asparagine synthase (glutamine-hydrolysing)